MSAPAPQCQPSIAPYQHVCPEADCIYYGKPTSPNACGCHRTMDQMMLARIQELERLLREARRCCDPAGDATRLTHAAMTAQIDAALEAKPAGETGK